MANTENKPSLALRRRDLPALLGALTAVAATLGFFAWQMTAHTPNEQRASTTLAVFGRDASDIALTDSNGAENLG